jgi:hypothetical protein
MRRQHSRRTGTSADHAGCQHYLEVLPLPVFGGQSLELAEVLRHGDELARGQRAPTANVLNDDDRLPPVSFAESGRSPKTAINFDVVYDCGVKRLLASPGHSEVS